MRKKHFFITAVVQIPFLVVIIPDFTLILFRILEEEGFIWIQLFIGSQLCVPSILQTDGFFGKNTKKVLNGKHSWPAYYGRGRLMEKSRDQVRFFDTNYINLYV